MRNQQAGRREQLWSSLSEGRAPQDGEVQTIAAKIWRDAFCADAALAWSQVEIGSPNHRKSIAAARAALGTFPAIPSRG